MSNDGKVAAVGGAKDIFLAFNGTWFSRLAIFSKPVGQAIQAFRTIVRWRSDVMTRRELDAFIDSALKILPQHVGSAEEDRAVLIAEGIITADGELAAEYRPAGAPAPLQSGAEGPGLGQAREAFGLHLAQQPNTGPCGGVPRQLARLA
jgi:hypothetical protein